MVFSIDEPVENYFKRSKSEMYVSRPRRPEKYSKIKNRKEKDYYSTQQESYPVRHNRSYSNRGGARYRSNKENFHSNIFSRKDRMPKKQGDSIKQAVILLLKSLDKKELKEVQEEVGRMLQW